MYHRIAEAGVDPWGLCVSPERFAEHLEVLRRVATVVSLERALDAIEHGRPLDRAVVLTFDDGYADNLSTAKPLLERFGVPATLFVATGYLGHRREFWWDELARVLLEPGERPPELEVEVGATVFRWDLGPEAAYTESDALGRRGWRALVDAPPGLRQAAYVALWEALSRVPAGEREGVLDALLHWARLPPGTRPAFRALAPAEVRDVARGGLIEIGAHTVTHPLLPSLPVAAQRDEIGASKAALEDVLGRPVVGFAYPGGRHTDGTARCVRDAGFRYACSIGDGKTGLSPPPDRWALPRVPAEDWSGAELEGRLRRAFTGGVWP